MNLSRMIDAERAGRIRSAISDVLLQQWDPIGVKDEPMASDEYDMYFSEIYGLLTKDASEERIAAHLRQIEIERMGFAEEQTPDRLNIAKILKTIALN